MSQRKSDPRNPFGEIDPFHAPVPFSPWHAPVRVELVDMNPRPAWLKVVERIMTKALEHKKAGRDQQFTQVLVPKDDFDALKEHFGEEPSINTCIGHLNVYPVNPDGATFID